MKTALYTIILFMLCSVCRAGLLINEIACGTSGNDWVELFLFSESPEQMNISHLYVTMYYGANEALSPDPITLYSRDRPETPYDDRFAVVHMTELSANDETDLTGDTNSNGYIDIYCNNYSGSLWNSDGVVALDTDDDPSNGGIIDFVAYSNRDGNINATIESYVEYAQSWGQWNAFTGENTQMCMVDIGTNGLAPYKTIMRNNTLDNNRLEDFSITLFQTPGRENISSGPGVRASRLFRCEKRKITLIPTHPVYGQGRINIFVYRPCNVRMRIFTSTGLCIYESPLYEDATPGFFCIPWNLRGLNRRACTGLYFGSIEATSSSLRKHQSEIVYLILSRYK